MYLTLHDMNWPKFMIGMNAYLASNIDADIALEQIEASQVSERGMFYYDSSGRWEIQMKTGKKSTTKIHGWFNHIDHPHDYAFGYGTVAINNGNHTRKLNNGIRYYVTKKEIKHIVSTAMLGGL